MKIKIITDSACDIPVSEKLSNVEIMNFHIAINGEDHEERVDFTMEEFYEILEKCDHIPTTAHITMIDFYEKYCKLAEEGITDIIHVTINSLGSATYNAALMGKQMYMDENPNSNLNITIIDSKAYSMAYGYHIICADKMIDNGASASEVIEFLQDRLAKTEVLLGTYSLKFMKKSGRISAAAAFAGELMGFRPVILMKDGKTEVIQKARGDKMLASAMAAKLKERISDKIEYCVGCTDEASKEAINVCTEVLGKAPKMVFNLGSAVSINAGPHSIGIVYLCK